MKIRTAWTIVRDPVEYRYSPVLRDRANTTVQRAALAVIGGCLLLLAGTFTVLVLVQ